MDICEGIKIVSDIPVSVLSKGRLFKSKGTINADEKEGYANKSFIPMTPWESLNAKDIKILFEREVDIEKNNWIGVVVPNAIYDIFKPLREFISNEKDPDLIKHKIKDHFSLLINDSLQHLLCYTETGPSDIHSSILHLSSPDLLTTTKDQDGNLIGLHVDSWYKNKISERDQAPNRLSINIGLESRYLLFINQSLMKINSLLAQEFPNDERRNGVGIGLRTAFMENYPGYPVIKLEIQPGEAYIAPTENIIHDGCTIGQNYPDLQFNLRGNFIYPKQGKI